MRSVFDSIDEGFAVAEMVVDEAGRAVDYRLIEVNPRFEEMTGLADASGRTALELVPDLETRWIDTYARVGLDRQTLRFEQGSEAMGRWFEVFAVPVEPRPRFAIVFKDQSQRRAAEEALRASEQRFRAMADDLPLVLWVHGPGGEQQWVNARFCEYFGVAREDMHGEQWKQLIHPDDLDAYTSRFKAAIVERRPFHSRVRVRRDDGRWRWFESWARPRSGPDGEHLGYIGASADVNEEMEAVAALAASESRFRSLIDLMPAGVYTCDLDGSITLFNEQAAQIWGRRPRLGDTSERFCGAQRLRLPDGSALEASTTPMARALRSAEGSRDEVVVMERPDGSSATVASYIDPLRDDDGVVTGAINVFVDIGDRVGVQNELADSEQRYRSVVEQASDGIFVADGQLRFVDVNPAGEQLLGYDRDELLGLVVADVIDPGEWTRIESELADLEPGQTIDSQWRFRCRNGSTFLGAVRGRVRPDGLFQGLIRDITLQAAAEAALVESADFTRRVLDQMFTFAGVLNPDGTLIEANNAPMAVAGLEPSDVIGRKFWDCSWWSYDSRVQHQLQKAVIRALDGDVVRYDVPVRVLHGELLWIDFQISPLRNDAGDITHLIASGTDLTARRNAQRRLLETVGREREARQRVELLRQAAANLAGAITVEDIATAVLTDVEKALGLYLGSLDVVADNRVRIYTAPGLHLDVVQHQPLVGIDAVLPGPVAIATNERVVVDSAEEIVQRFPEIADVVDRYPVASIVALPLRTPDGTAIGAMVLGATEPAWFTHDRLELLTSLANQTAQALQRACLHQQILEARDREHAISRRLQESLLPDKLVEHPALPVAARYHAATEALTVGGDWYDTFTWPDGQIGLIVGDVAGHDLDAAAAMGRLRAALAALAPVIEPEPAEVLAALDRCATGPAGAVYVTAACVVVDPATGEARYATAGHPPPLLVRSNGAVEWLDEAISPPAGVLSDDVRPQVDVKFGPGDTVVLYSDGLIERRNRSIGEGLDLLASIASGGTDTGPADREGAGALDDLVDRLIAKLTTGSASEDDVAILAARYTPVPTDLHHRLPAATSHLAELRQQLDVWLAHHGITGGARDDIQLALSEAVTNAMEHAYHDSDQPGTVTVDLSCSPSDVVARVSDHGTWRPPTPDPDRGRGTAIMQAIATHFQRETGAKGTIVTLHLPTMR